MQNQQIVDYIRQRLQLGHAELDIRRELERTGWPTAEIQTAWEDATALPVVSAHEPLPGDKAPEVIAKLAHTKQQRKVLVIIVAAAVILAVLASAGLWAWHHVHAPKVAYSSGGNSPNNVRQDDAGLIGEAISNYIGNNGVLPEMAAADTTAKTLDICGKTCDQTETTTQLYYYKPSNVTYRAYAAGLAVPNNETVYIVNGAECKKDAGGLGGQAASGHDAAVILYALAGRNGPQQKCLSLQGTNSASP